MLDTERLRRDLLRECEAGFFGGGIGSDFIAAVEIERADEKKLIRFAREYRFNIHDYETKDEED